MPASRAEIYVRNDSAHADTKVYILRTKGLDAGLDVWPEIPTRAGGARTE